MRFLFGTGRVTQMKEQPVLVIPETKKQDEGPCAHPPPRLRPASSRPEFLCRLIICSHAQAPVASSTPVPISATRGLGRTRR